MKINIIRIGNFGRFSEKELSFGDGLNIVRGDNEAGKSTIFAFIRAMFFGIDIKRGAAGKDDVYLRYLPWNNPGAFSGSIDFEYGESRYRISRCFLKNSQECCCTNLDTMKNIELPSGRITDLIPELNESNYANTIAVGQQSIPVGKNLADGVKNYVANLAMAKTGEVDIPGALERLKNREKQLKNLLKEADISELRAKRDELAAVISGKEEEAAELDRECREHEKNLKKDEELAEQLKEKAEKQKELCAAAKPADMEPFDLERKKINREADEKIKNSGNDFKEKSLSLTGELESEKAVIEKKRQQLLFDAKTAYEGEKRSFGEKRKAMENELADLGEKRKAILEGHQSNNVAADNNSLKQEENAKKTEEVHLKEKECKKRFISGLMLVFIGMATAYLFSGKSRIGIGAGMVVALFGIVFFLISYIKDRELVMAAEVLDKEKQSLEEEEKRIQNENHEIVKRLERIAEEKERLQEQDVHRRYSEMEAEGRYENESRSIEERAAAAKNELELKFKTMLNEGQVKAEKERGRLEADRQQRLNELRIRESEACREAENIILERDHELEKLQRELDFLLKEQEMLRVESGRKLRSLEILEQELEVASGKMSEVEERLQSCETVRRDTEVELKAVGLAYETISNMSALIYERFGKKLNRMLSELAAKLTDGKYSDVTVQQDMSISFMSDVDYRNVRGLSAGTADQLYLALRLAVGRLFFETEELPVLLDEPFAFYDEKRLKSAIGELIESGRQIVLFTCREAEEQRAEEAFGELKNIWLQDSGNQPKEYRVIRI